MGGCSGLPGPPPFRDWEAWKQELGLTCFGAHMAQRSAWPIENSHYTGDEASSRIALRTVPSEKRGGEIFPQNCLTTYTLLMTPVRNAALNLWCMSASPGQVLKMVISYECAVNQPFPASHWGASELICSQKKNSPTGQSPSCLRAKVGQAQARATPAWAPGLTLSGGHRPHPRHVDWPRARGPYNRAPAMPICDSAADGTF